MANRTTDKSGRKKNQSGTQVNSKTSSKAASSKSSISAKATQKVASVTSLRPKSAPQSVTETSNISNVLAEPPKPLSLKEKGVLEFLEIYMREHGVSPTYQEICQHFGFASYNSVQRYLKQLEVKGYIQLPWSNQKRAITLLRPASAFQDSLPPTRPERESGGSDVVPAIMPTETFQLPLLGSVAAGSPIEALEHDEFIDVPASLVRHADRTFALRVQGQSMIDDGILDGDVILVQRQSSASNGEIVVAVINEEATVKRFYLHKGEKAAAARRDDDEERSSANSRMIELRPANSTMAPMWFDPGEVQIRGVVVGLIRRFF